MKKLSLKEELKQETLEEVAEKYVDIKHRPSSGIPNKGIQNFYDCRNAFKDGAKWQQKQYTIEEQHVEHSIGDLEKEYIKGFNEGSKWQQERSYSEEEVFEIVDKVFHMYASSYRQDAKKWLTIFKKK